MKTEKKHTAPKPSTIELQTAKKIIRLRTYNAKLMSTIITLIEICSPSHILHIFPNNNKKQPKSNKKQDYKKLVS